MDGSTGSSSRSPEGKEVKRTSSSPEQFFKEFKGLFEKKTGSGGGSGGVGGVGGEGGTAAGVSTSKAQSASSSSLLSSSGGASAAPSSSSSSSSSSSGRGKSAPRRTSLLGPWLQQPKKGLGKGGRSGGGSGGGGGGGGGGTAAWDDAAGGGGGARGRSSRVMSSRYWGGQYRVCTSPSVLREQLSTAENGDYVRNEVIGRVPISAWLEIIGFLDVPSMARVKVVSLALQEVADHTILRSLGAILTLDGERNLLEVISHPKGKSCAEDLWLLRFFDPVQIELQKRSLRTAQMLQELGTCVCVEDVVAVLRELRSLRDINFSMAKFHETITEAKKSFDALGRDEWRVQVQPVLADVVRDCRFAGTRPPGPLELFEAVENSQAKGNLFKKKEEVKCNGSVWDGYDSEYMFTYFEGGSGELWHWPSGHKKAKLVSSMKLGNQRPTGAAMGQTRKRCIAYGAQFQSTISVMRAHNSDWTRVPKALDASATSSLVEAITLTGHEGYVSSVQFFAQDQYLVSGSGDSSVKVWDLERKYIVRDITSAHRADVLCVSTSKLANHVFLTAGAEGTVIFHDHRVEKPLFSVGKFTSDVGAIKFHQNGMKVLAGSFDGSCCIFDSRKPGPEICEYTVPGTVLGCDFYCNMGDSEEAVIIAEESNIQVVYDRPDVESYVLNLHSDRITSLNTSLDSRLAVSSWDGLTSIWMS